MIWTISWKTQSAKTQEEIDYLNRPMYIKYIAFVINNFPNQKAPGLQGEFHQKFKEEIIQIIYNFFQKIEAEGILPN